MKAPKIKRYRLGVSRTFPTTHPRKGEQTYFIPKIELGLGLVNNTCSECSLKNGNSEMCRTCFITNGEVWSKLHTIRGDYKLWSKRIEKVQAGEAVIELFYWEGKPYQSKQVVFATLDKDSGCGVQELMFNYHSDFYKQICYPFVLKGIGVYERLLINFSQLTKNDGLLNKDFISWFKGYDLSQPMAIIQFTGFRY